MFSSKGLQKMFKFNNNDIHGNEILDSSMTKDCERIVKIFNDHGYNLSIRQAQMMWQLYCDSINSNLIWDQLPVKDDSVFSQLEKFIVALA